jgi:hypothetical protein
VGTTPSSVTLWAIKSMEYQGIHFYAGDISTLICVCCPIESYGKKMRNSKPFATFLDAVNGFHLNNRSYLL